MQEINKPAVLILMVLLSMVCYSPPITATSAPAVGLSTSPSINRIEHKKVNFKKEIGSYGGAVTALVVLYYFNL